MSIFSFFGSTISTDYVVSLLCKLLDELFTRRRLGFRINVFSAPSNQVNLCYKKKKWLLQHEKCNIDQLHIAKRGLFQHSASVRCYWMAKLSFNNVFVRRMLLIYPFATFKVRYCWISYCNMQCALLLKF